MKLLLISAQTAQSKGGIAVWTDLFLNACPKAGVECTLVNIATVGKRAEQGNAGRSLKDEIVRTKRIFRSLKQTLSAGTYDAAHINTACGLFGVWRDYRIAKKIRKAMPQASLVLQVHCDARNEVRAFNRPIMKKLLKTVDIVSVLNRANREHLKDVYGCGSVIVPNFIDGAMIRREDKAVSSTLKTAVFVGYVQPAKGMLELIEAAKSHPEITFRLVGEVHDAIREADKPDNVVLEGPRDRQGVCEALDAADVLFFPSHSEGFSLAMLEGMARGLPVIATDVGANAEMLGEDGGVIVKVGDVDAMRNALDRLQDETLRAAMSKRNVQKVQSDYTVDAVMAQLTALYQKA